MEGIEASVRAGLDPVKLNAVLIRGQNDDEVDDFIRLAKDLPIEVRFIELMPFGNQNAWDMLFPSLPSRFLPVQEMHDRLGSLEMQPVDYLVGNGPARMYKIPGAKGTVGFISPLGEHFCASCNRIRLTADGKLRACLFSDGEVDVKTALRQGEVLDDNFRQVMAQKPKGHDLDLNISQTLEQLDPSLARTMSQIGG
jgi:cyclic pyranopterin phosphate synthase